MQISIPGTGGGDDGIGQTVGPKEKNRLFYAIRPDERAAELSISDSTVAEGAAWTARQGVPAPTGSTSDLVHVLRRQDPTWY